MFETKQNTKSININLYICIEKTNCEGNTDSITCIEKKGAG